MAGREALGRLLADLGRSMGLPGLAPDEGGLVALAFENGVVLHIGHEPPTDLAVLYVELSVPVPEAETLARLLEANLTAAETGGACFALDGRSGRPFLVRRLAPQVLAYPEFEAAARTIVEAAEVWQQRLARPEMPREGETALEPFQGLRA